MFIIDEETLPKIKDKLFPKDKGRGAIPRNYSEDPITMFQSPSEMSIIAPGEWSDRIKDAVNNKSRISDILTHKMVPCLDQGPNGYCWGHSTVGVVQAVRAVMGLPTVPLSAYAVCATIKKGKNEGGWCGLSAKFIRERGIPSQAIWPQGDRDYQKYDKAETWANAEKHKSLEDWVDLTRNVYDQNLTLNQLATCLLSRIPCAVDFNWWAHSVLACDLVEVEPGSFGILIRNSWGAGWGENGGYGVLRGNKAIPDGALGIRSVMAA